MLGKLTYYVEVGPAYVRHCMLLDRLFGAHCKRPARTASELESGPEFVREFRICGIGTAASFAKEFSELWDKATGTLAFLSALHEKTHN